ncbi:hypothetical protein DRQ53_06415 [bacterium]|nr:MAG: hypothetical protein DRQ32_01030 [bacterium]RKZ16406.1 MAG: hypothetical protein DRQ53_06415 [bacterium]
MLDRAVDFSLGLLSDAEQRELLEEARSDPEFEAILQEQCAARESGRATGVPGANQQEARSGHSRRRFLARPRRIAAMAALVAASVALLLVFRPQPDADLYWLPMDGALTTPRAAESLQDDWRAGVQLYATHELDAAIEVLENADAQGATAQLRDIYLASALLNDGRTAEAAEVLRRVDLASLPHPWRGYAQEIQRRLADEH